MIFKIIWHEVVIVEVFSLIIFAPPTYFHYFISVQIGSFRFSLFKTNCVLNIYIYRSYFRIQDLHNLFQKKIIIMNFT